MDERVRASAVVIAVAAAMLAWMSNPAVAALLVR